MPAHSKNDRGTVRVHNLSIGATIMGRNMFGPVRGPWPDEEWKGWWGDDPPFHHSVFVLTHHPREPSSSARMLSRTAASCDVRIPEWARRRDDRLSMLVRHALCRIAEAARGG
jgi:dihydrofolate reductase